MEKVGGMDKNISDYFHQFQGEGSESGDFHKVLALHSSKDWDWDELKSLSPELPRGWYELSQLTPEDRIEFTRDHWMAKLPFQPHLLERLELFFSRLDTIAIFLTQHSLQDETYRAHFVYSIKDDGGFFQGFPPADEDGLAKLQEAYAPIMLPADYCAFMRIHDGFQKSSDIGVLNVEAVEPTYQRLQEHLELKPPITLHSGDQLNPKSLIPFYNSFGLDCYQCFWTEWFAEGEIGNVYYSGLDHFLCEPEKGQDADVCLAFPTFLSWLMFYLEGIS